MELLQTLRKIRACEGDAAAQLLLEAFVAQEVASERERCACVCEAIKDSDTRDAYEYALAVSACATAIRKTTRPPPDFLDALKYDLAARGG